MASFRLRCLSVFVMERMRDTNPIVCAMAMSITCTVGCKVEWNKRLEIARVVLAAVSKRFFLRKAMHAGTRNPALVKIKPQNGICFRSTHVGEMSATETNSPRILGEGSFGCVMKPAPKCVGKERRIAKSNAKVTVSKVFADSADFRYEVAASKKVAKVDPKGKHILVPTSYCDTTYGAVSMHPAADNCELIQDLRFSSPTTKMYQLKMPYGGQRFDKYIKSNTVSLTEFVQHMIHVLEGVQKLQKHGMCHQDLKASNLLIAAGGQAMIIDYSLMLPFQDVYTSKNIGRLRHSYFPYPPEYKIFYLVYRRICDDKQCEDLMPQIMKNLEHYGTDRLQRMVDLHGDIEQYVATFYRHVLRNKRRLVSTFATYAKKMDVYSVGAIMLDMDKYIDKRKVTAASIRSYYDAISGMTMIDPRKRLSVTQAIKKLKSIV